MERLFEEVFVEVCAPTLRGIKPSNLFRYQPQNRDKLLEALDFWNRELEPSGLQVRALKECSRTGAFLILVYREEWLRFILGKISVQNFLKKSGYQMKKTVDGFLRQLSNRLCLEHDFHMRWHFPGGIRLRMLLDSLKIRGKNYTCSGYWKTYGDPQEAKRAVCSYRECTEVCREKYRQGTPIIQLVKAA